MGSFTYFFVHCGKIRINYFLNVMKNSTRQNVLLILTSEDETRLFRSILEAVNCDVTAIKNSEVAIQRVVEYQPDLIICENEMGDSNGFQVFNHLKKYLLKNGIPFFLYMDHFDKDDILIGLELGMDNFVIAPVESSTLINKIENHFQKINESKLFDRNKFDIYFETTPVAKFTVRNNRLEKTNKAFRTIFNLSDNVAPFPLVTEIFDFSDNNELYYRKCMNGLIQHCYLKNVRSIQPNENLFDIHFCNCENSDHGAIMADVVPANMFKRKVDYHNQLTGNSATNGANNNEPNEQVSFTIREQEILKLSAQGLPIKQIAAMLNVSNRTVEKHRANIMKKTGSNNIIEAIVVARNNNWFKPEIEMA